MNHEQFLEIIEDMYNLYWDMHLKYEPTEEQDKLLVALLSYIDDYMGR